MSNLSKTTASLVKRTSFSAAVTPSIIGTHHHITDQQPPTHEKNVNKSRTNQNQK